jgi:hypothetical protein
MDDKVTVIFSFPTALITFIFIVLGFVAVAMTSFANTTIPQACKKLKGVDHHCSCMSYKGRVGWIQWSNFGSGILALGFLYIAIRLWSGPRNGYVSHAGILWFFLCLLFVWSIGLYLTEDFMYKQCDDFSNSGQYTEQTAKYIHRANLAVMITIVTIISCLIIANVVAHFKNYSDPSSMSRLAAPSSEPVGLDTSFGNPSDWNTSFRGGARLRPALDWYWKG